MERRLEPKEQEAKIIGHCPICGEELYEGYEYTMFGGKMLCGSQECYKAILKRIVTLTDFEAYAKSQYEDFALWGKGRIMEAIEKGGRSRNPSSTTMPMRTLSILPIGITRPWIAGS